MYPENDVVCNLLETPFSRWKDEDKKDLLTSGRPTVPLDFCFLKSVKKIEKSYKITFKNSWFSEFTWLCSSKYLQKLFCWPCLLFSTKHNAWNRQGFGDFQNITRSLHKHEDSGEHLKCKFKLRTFERNRNSIADALKENARLCVTKFNENVRLNRQLLRIVIKAVLYLSKQELAFRGHDESVSSTNRGNFKELLSLLISETSVENQCHYDKIKNIFSGNSKTIQNEILGCISEYLQDHIKHEISNASFFSVEVDDTTDICQKSQCSVIVRFVGSEGTVVERFLGFYDVSADRSAANLFDLLDNILKELCYEKKLIAQCYDGASVMSGQLNGLQKRVKDKAPQAVFVHCMAHRYNLVLQQSCNKISKCRIFFASLSGIPSFFHHSAKRTHMIELTGARRVPSLTDTRWSSNSKLLNVIIGDWNKIKSAFQLILDSEDADTKSVRLCNGFLNEMNNFEFTLLAVVFNDIFGYTDILFDVLQKKSLDIVYCAAKIKLTCDLLSNQRNEQHFSALFEKSKSLTDINLRRGCTATEEELFRSYLIIYYEILDTILMEMRLRFQDCNRLRFLSLADATKFEEYARDLPCDGLECLQECYPQIFCKSQRLRQELRLFYSDDSYRNLTSEKIVQLLEKDKDIFEETYKLFCLILTIPSTSSSVERSFSCLKRLKTFTRNATSQNRLSTLATIALHRDVLSTQSEAQTFYEDIIDRFAALKDRRIELVYKK